MDDVQIDSLWISTLDRTARPQALYNAICDLTEHLVGWPLNPHLFRDCVISETADWDPAHLLAYSHSWATLLWKRQPGLPSGQDGWRRARLAKGRRASGKKQVSIHDPARCHLRPLFQRVRNQASIEDQLRLCRQRIEREGGTLVATHFNRAASGASHLRPGFQVLLEQCSAGTVDVVVAEALDRLSRDQEHIAAFYRQLSFAGVRILALADGWIDELHVGLKGTMNALFLKDLAAMVGLGQAAAGNKKAAQRAAVSAVDECSVKVVAGARFELTTFRL